MRKVCVYTSTRAEYGLLRNLIYKIHISTDLQLQLLVSGSHLISGRKMTVEELYNDGFEPNECVDINLLDDSPKGICDSMGIAMSKYGKFFSKYNPDILVLLGDRFETFCCAAAAHVCRIPIAHIHGGETTQGAIDEAFRHSITKMAHFHFPCCEDYKQRIVQLGERPEHVYNVGALGVENIRNSNLMNRETLEDSIGFKLDKPFFLVTFHPVTLEKNNVKKQCKELLSVLERYPDHKLIFTGTNADTGGRIIDRMVKEYKTAHPSQCLVIPSLGYLRYLSAMKLCKAVVGNSSSGVLEAPALKVPSINIGDRQKGRIKAGSVINCEPYADSIYEALKKINDDSFQIKIKNMVIPFEKSGTAERIKKIIKHVDLTDILKKKFFDIVWDKNFIPKNNFD